ncbi:MAG: aminotransferase class I/II-fold pyridoxal phosphate-dependent enzyme [Lachnospiraceae bacterium]|nr:aminotransferase class I/II-fold pyridoxal phosphate-dependent enzyme [Ruminococcus sp.]MCM1274614.1 aminotransferase class I/II-fold pyridoxal phosphate-dependent enzyme [Lachnospiraceae bacterium]
MSWQDNLIKIEPYTAGEQPNKTDFIKLNANENPYPPSPRAIAAIREYDASNLKKYPSANAVPLVNAIAKREGLLPENVFAGNGTDDVLSLCFRAFFNSRKPIIFPDVTYSFNTVWCDILNIPYETIPVDEDFGINAADYARENGGVVIANPNAPTSIGRGLDFIREIMRNNRESVVIIDEAYVDFGGTSAVPLLEEFDNLVITRTFSKSRSMAGMRLGWAMGSKTAISAIYAAKDSMNSYPVDSIAQAAGVAAIEDEEYFQATLKRVIATRERLAGELRRMGFKLPDSQTNFLFATHPQCHAQGIFEFLKSRDIYVRWFNKPRIDNYLRITVGTDEETDKLIDALKELTDELEYEQYQRDQWSCGH